MNITINTDASFCPTQKVGGFAFWITSDIGRIKRMGGLKSVETAQDSELKCLANAVYVLLNSKLNNGSINKIYINSDCLWMFQSISYSSGNKIGRYITHTIYKIFENNHKKGVELKTRYELRHVKAHTNKLDKSRNWVNNWCDKNAKIEMKKMRN